MVKFCFRQMSYFSVLRYELKHAKWVRKNKIIFLTGISLYCIRKIVSSFKTSHVANVKTLKAHYPFHYIAFTNTASLKWEFLPGNNFPLK